MNPTSLPEEFELIGFFEVEPKLASPGVPWLYNNVHFVTIRGEDEISCELEPAYGELKLRWKQAGIVRAEVRLNRIESLSVQMNGSEEVLIANGLGISPSTLLKLRLKPVVVVEIGCWHEVR
jgi:hypothetical protein